MSELESKHYLMNGSETLPDAREALEWAAETRVSMVDLKFCDLLGTWQHMTLPLRAFGAERVRGGPRLRRLLDPRLAGDLGVGHAADARSELGDPRSRHRGADALARLRDRRPDHDGGLLTRSAAGREARRGVPPLDRDRRHLLRRPRVRVLRLRRGQLRPRPERRALRRRLRRGLLELRPARARLHVAPEGGLLPDGAARLAARPPHRDGADARAARHPVRVPSPRGRVRRPVRDRPSLPDA